MTEDGRHEFATRMLQHWTQRTVPLDDAAEHAQVRALANDENAVCAKYMEFAQYFGMLAKGDPALIRGAFECYLRGTLVFHVGWDQVKYHADYAVACLGTIAKTLSHLPSSEAVCERAIPLFKWLFKTDRERSDLELITAEMRIRAHARSG